MNSYGKNTRLIEFSKRNPLILFQLPVHCRISTKVLENGVFFFLPLQVNFTPGKYFKRRDIIRTKATKT